MSNKIVPQVYRTIIDDVINQVSADFDEYGLDEEVLQNLQAKWEARLLETRVADFARAPNAPGEVDESDIDPNLDARVASHYPPSGPSDAGPSNAPQPPFGLAFPPPGHGLALPGQMMGQQYNAQMAMQGMSGTAGGSGENGNGVNGLRAYDGMTIKQDPDDLLRLRGGAGEDEKPDVKPEPNAAGLLPGDEVIDSDLDDSDDELKDDGDEEGEGDIDIVFCVYDKVQRVKNKWKTVFKDGMIHVNGRDYLFAKCNGEFEW